MDMMVFKFEDGGGRENDPKRPGKSTWPHCFHLQLDRFRAGILAEQLVRFLSSKEEEFVYSTVGEMRDVDEETGEETPIESGEV